MRRFLFTVGIILVIGIAGLWWLKFERQPPTAEIESTATTVGRQAKWDVVVRAHGHAGLRRIEVRLKATDQAYELFAEELPRVSWLGSGVSERRLQVEADLAAAGVPQGPAELEVLATTYAWHVVPQRARTIASASVMIDLTPPTVALLSRQHNIRLGGSAAAVFRVSEDTEESGIAVGDYFFPAVAGFFTDPAVAIALFAVPQDLSADAQPKVRVVDGVGNTREVALPVSIRTRTFPERKLEISDAFLARKVPELFAAIGQPEPQDPVEGYLYLNGELRKQSEKKLDEIVATSADEPLWSGAFRRQTNAAPMSAFADRRIYLYDGKEIDRQTHLGYDLASLKRAPVEAAQNGTVLFADYLGIYGNTVVLDHGMGVSSLYGHLSTFAVQPGQTVEAGETIGQTGETGLAGGDHLHFSIMVRGTHVDPVEWWDGKWIRDHVAAKLSMFARDAESQANEPGAAPPPAESPEQGGAPSDAQTAP